MPINPSHRIALLCFVLVGVGSYFLLFNLGFERTKYTEKFSEREFARIEPGFTPEQVLHNLSYPLKAMVYRGDDQRIVWECADVECPERIDSLIRAFHPDAKLMHDLRLFGDDADDFLGRLQAEFPTDFSHLEFSRYFYEESNTLSLMLFCGWY